MEPDSTATPPLEPQVPLYKNREQAGHALSKLLQEKVPLLLKTPHPPRVIALLRGGFPVAQAISSDLHLPLSTLLIQKVSSPAAPEFALGALAEDQSVVWNESAESQFSEEFREKFLEDAKKKLRIKAGIEHRIFPQSLVEQIGNNSDLAKHLVLLVDDGVATGATVHAAAIYLHSLGFQRIRLCVPVIARDTYEKLYDRGIFEAIHACEIQPEFESVGQAYLHFPQLEWKEIAEAFTSSRRTQGR